jgi:hypothetical protein
MPFYIHDTSPMPTNLGFNPNIYEFWCNVKVSFIDSSKAEVRPSLLPLLTFRSVVRPAQDQNVALGDCLGVFPLIDIAS